MDNWFEMALYLKFFLKFRLTFQLWSKNKKINIFEISPNDFKLQHIIKKSKTHLDVKLEPISTVFE